MTEHEPTSWEEIPPPYRRLYSQSGLAGRRTSDRSILNQLLVLTLPYVPKPIVRQVAKRYIAGETMADMHSTVLQLNALGAMATVDLLGEFIHELKSADEAAQAYKEILDLLAREKLDANVSVKLSALGLLLDESYCLALMRDLVGHAQKTGNFVRIDMEDSACTEKTIRLYLALRAEFTNVGIVIQAYLRRSHDDVNRIIDAGAGHFRLCKGIYIEPRWLAYPQPDVINLNYEALLETMIQRGAYVGIATHDERLVWAALNLIRKYDLKPDQYEFQMLLGVDPELRDLLIASGHRVRVYVPFGQHWHAYCLRRLKENPKIAGYIFQNLVRPSP